MSSEPDITIVLATLNNAPDLRRTLESFSGTDRSGLKVEFAIVDNNSTDETKSVIEQFRERLSIHYLHEPRRGKNAALNRALGAVKLGRLVFFTDDDVEVPNDLFPQIVNSSTRNQDCSVFGGHVHMVWPPGKAAAWATAFADSFRAYSHLDLGPDECVFPPHSVPIGPNWWLRREVLEKGYRYDERIGPGSRPYIMGSETTFLARLKRDGYRIIYAPGVRVGHRVAPRLLVEKVMIRRGLAAGRAGAVLAYEYDFGPKRYIRNNSGWMLVRGACLARWALCYALAFLSPGKTRQMLRRWDAMQGIGWNLEALRIASGRTRG